MDPSQFYTGLVADLYAPLRSSVYDDPTPWQRFIEAAGEPALELGCGDGDPLLSLRERGLDVHGLDSSADMLDRCRAAAVARGLEVTLYHQPMEHMDLPLRYRAIFLAGPTFNLLPDDATALRALASVQRHLAEDGTALIPLFVPDPPPELLTPEPREEVLSDGTILRVTAIDISRDESSRTQTTMLRYERIPPAGSAERLERPWLLHWYDQATFAELARRAGLDVQEVRPTDGADGTSEWEVLLTQSPRESGRGTSDAGQAR